MMEFYDVYERGRRVDTVKAYSPKDACRQVYMKRGSASRYTGKGIHDYEAIVTPWWILR